MLDFRIILPHVDECSVSLSAIRRGRLPSPLRDESGRPSLEGHIVVFTGKLSSLGRKDARALVMRLGGRTSDDVNAKTTMLVIGAEGFGPAFQPDAAALEPDTTLISLASAARAQPPAFDAGDHAARDKSNKLKRAEELNGQRGTARAIEIVTEEEFCRLAGVPTPGTLKQQYHALRDVLARYRALREDHLRYLVKCGVLRPVVRTNADTYFAFPDLAVIRQANEGLGQGAPFRSVVRSLVAARQGQLEFDFRLDAEPAKIIALRQPKSDRGAASHAKRELPPPRHDAALAEEYFRAASALDDGDESTQEGAAAAYRKALELDPYLVPALINLANIHYSRGETVEAQALYTRAIGLEPDFFEAHFNLGNIYHDLARFEEAQTCYLEALHLNPLYADAHFYLAVIFEKMGQSQEARPHWRAYQQLAPQGEWVALAKEFSE
jgi:tetratricopeptide (TPR) repeat protein